MDLDLDLDLGRVPPPAAPPACTADGRRRARRADAAATSTCTTTPDDASGHAARPRSAPAAAATATAGDLDFDLGDLRRWTAPPTSRWPRRRPPRPDTALGLRRLRASAGAAAAPPPATADDDPLARKLELAEEFRQIGDLEGARDLLEEVVAKADGALQTKAQGMLDELA